jgi:hypothetical protein
MKINEVTGKIKEDASAGGTSSGSMATSMGVPNNKVGSLFGGTYKQPANKKTKKRTK